MTNATSALALERKQNIFCIFSPPSSAHDAAQFFLGTVRLILLSLSGFLVPLGSCSVAMVTGLQLESQSPIIVSFFFLLMPAVRQAINSAFSLTGNA